MANELPSESNWAGMISGQREMPEVIEIQLPLQPSPGGIAGSFRVVGTDGQRWWVKPPHQGELDMALVTEFIVSRAGAMIGAPTCQSTVIEITADFEGWEYSEGKRLQAGLGHAVLEVDAALEERLRLEYRSADDNAIRQAGVYALYDWCWGADQQWLHSTTNDMTIYSHDHGWYLPPSGATWEVSSMRTVVDIPHKLSQPPIGLDNSAVGAAADALDKVDRGGLASLLRQVPDVWPATDNELETIGWFLERRARAAATRMRELL